MTACSYILAVIRRRAKKGSIDGHAVQQGSLAALGRVVERGLGRRRGDHRPGLRRPFRSRGASPEAIGRRVEYAGMDLLRVKDGKIAEYWLCADILHLLQQLGVIPS